MKKYIHLYLLIHCTLAQNELINKFQICKRSDPKLNNCLKDAIQNALSIMQYGINEFKIPSLQPLEIPFFVDKSNKYFSFDQVYENIKIYNLPGATIETVEASISDNNFSLKITGNLPVLELSANYRFDNAVILGQDISGNGSMLHYQGGTQFSLDMIGEVDRKGLKPILIISSTSYKVKIEDIDTNLQNFHFRIDSDNDHLKNNWKILYEGIKLVNEDMYSEVSKNITNFIFSQLDYDQVFPK